jgi:hypothetical protein
MLGPGAVWLDGKVPFALWAKRYIVLKGGFHA